MIHLPFHYGFTLFRWLNSLHYMLLKKDKYYINKLRIIQWCNHCHTTRRIPTDNNLLSPPHMIHTILIVHGISTSAITNLPSLCPGGTYSAGSAHHDTVTWSLSSRPSPTSHLASNLKVSPNASTSSIISLGKSTTTLACVLSLTTHHSKQFLLTTTTVLQS